MKAIRAIGLGVVLGLWAPAACSRPSGSEVSPADVSALARTGKFSEALRAGKRLVERAPGTAEAHDVYGVVLARVRRFDEAAAEFARARQLAPDNGQIAKDHAAALAESGRMAEARAVAAEVARRWPAVSRELQPIIDELDEEARQAKNASLAAGSAPAFVAQLLDKVARGDLEDVVRSDLDRASLGRTCGADTDPGLCARVATAGFLTSVSLQGPTKIRGYEVSPDTREVNGRTVVEVELFSVRTIDSKDIPALEAALAKPGAPVPLFPDDAVMLHALDPADRRASLVAIAAHPTAADLPIALELTGAPGAWKLADVVVEDIRLSAELEGLRAKYGSPAKAAPAP